MERNKALDNLRDLMKLNPQDNNN